MKNPILLVLGTALFWAPTWGLAAPIDTLKVTLVKSSTTQSSRARIGLDFHRTPSAYLLESNLSGLRLLKSSSSSRSVAFDLPVSGHKSLPLVIHEIDVAAPGFRVSTSSGKTLPLPALKFYAGKIAGDDASTAALSISDTGIEGLIYGKEYSYTVGNVRNAGSNQLHVVYQTQELTNPSELNCKPQAAPVPASVGQPREQGPTSRRMVSSACRGVAIYFEVDYQMYQEWGRDLTYITNKILATFANVVILYAQEGIRLELSEIKIWDTPDPYGQTNTPVELLSQFKSYWNVRGNSFNGDIAHLLSTHISSGGLAYYGISRRNTISTVNDISAVFSNQDSRSFAFGISTGIHDLPLNPLPAYSYNVYIIAHELGHNFGLPHSQSCLWNGGPLDNCGTPEDGTCPSGPELPNQGTIMSYCPNLANGFGAQPSAKMKYEYLAALNLMNQGANPVQIAPATLTANQGQYTTLEVANCTGTVLWSDGVSSGNSRTILPMEPSAYYAACLSEGCLSASANVTLATQCVKPALCSLSASGELSTLYGIAAFTFSDLLTQASNGVSANLGTCHEDFTCTQHALLKAGESYPFSLSVTYGSFLSARIYIDYNGNGEFTEADELVYDGPSLSQHSGTITISPTARLGTPLRMRVMVNSLPIPDACSLPSTQLVKSGKANDYAITITNSTCPPQFRETVKSGRWDDPLVWSCGSLPTALDQVKINPGHYITLPADFSGFAGSIDLQGVIQPGNNSRLLIEYP